uniref:Maestro heat like repeat family member 1 n=1 Tax=Latimeria chalumnae TaxID=7897 RepID=H3ASN0_LATCH
RGAVLKMVETAVRHNLDQLQKGFAEATIIMAVQELTTCKQYLVQWPLLTKTREKLEKMGEKWINPVSKENVTRETGILPHFFFFFVIFLSRGHIVVPYMKQILDAVTPSLKLEISGNLKPVFCQALYQISESIRDYLENPENGTDCTISKECFYKELSMIFDVMATYWLNDSDAKVRMAAAEVLGSMAHLVPQEMLTEQLPRVIPNVSLRHFLSRILINLISSDLKQPLSPILNRFLYQRVCYILDCNTIVIYVESAPLQLLVIALCMISIKLIAFFSPTLSSQIKASAQENVGSLQALCANITHIFTATPWAQPPVQSWIIGRVSDVSNRTYALSRYLSWVICAEPMLSHATFPGSYVQNLRSLTLPFPGQQSAMCRTYALSRCLSRVTHTHTHTHTRTVSGGGDYCISKCVQEACLSQQMLWSHLLKFVPLVKFSNALAPICRCLIFLEEKVTQEGADPFDSYKNSGSYSQLVIYLFVVSFEPFERNQQGVQALHLLQVVGPIIHLAVCPIWNEQIPLFLTHLKSNSHTITSSFLWHKGLIAFLISETLEAIGDDDWTYKFCTEISKQHLYYNELSQEKGFLCQCFGAALQWCKNSELVQEQLQELLMDMGTDLQEESVREGLAKAVGICASNNLDIVLAALEDFGNTNLLRYSVDVLTQKQSEDEMPILKQTPESEKNYMRSVMILSYGYVMLNTPMHCVHSQLNSILIPQITAYFDTTQIGVRIQDKTLKLSLLKCVGLIAQGIDNVTTRQDFNFSKKKELLTYLMACIKKEPAADILSTRIRSEALVACSHLVKLAPALNEPEKKKLISICMIRSFLNNPSFVAIIFYHFLKQYRETLRHLEDLFNNILSWDLTPAGLQTLLKLVMAWLHSKKSHEKYMVLSIMSSFLEFYLKKVNIETKTTVSNLGNLIGLLAPSCIDSAPEICQKAKDSIYSLLYMQLYHEVSNSEDFSSVTSEVAMNGPDSIVNHGGITFLYCLHVNTTICYHVPESQLMPLISSLFKVLKDGSELYAVAASFIISDVIEVRGAELKESVLDVLRSIYIHMQTVTLDSMKSALQDSLRSLTLYHPDPVMSSFLTYPLPFYSHVCDMWEALIQDESLTAIIVKTVMGKINQQSGTFVPVRLDTVPMAVIFQVICSFREILSSHTADKIVQEMYPVLFRTTLSGLSQTLGVFVCSIFNSTMSKAWLEADKYNQNTLEASKCGVETLKLMLLRGGSEKVVTIVERGGGWEMLEQKTKHADGVILLARAMVEYEFSQISGITEELLSHACNSNKWRRISVTAFFSELLAHQVVFKLNNWNSLVDHMFKVLEDSSGTVRRLALQGLGNASQGSPAKARSYVGEMLNAFLYGMEDADDPDSLIQLEALSSFSKTLPLVKQKDIHTSLTCFCVQIQVFFEDEKDPLRASAFRVFGELFRYQKGKSKMIMRERLQANIITLVFHLSDPCLEVAKACRFALWSSAKVIEPRSLQKLLVTELHENKRLDYDDFQVQFCEQLVQNLPMELVFYVSNITHFYYNKWPSIRAAAAKCMG